MRRRGSPGRPKRAAERDLVGDAERQVGPAQVGAHRGRGEAGRARDFLVRAAVRIQQRDAHLSRRQQRGAALRREAQQHQIAALPSPEPARAELERGARPARGNRQIGRQPRAVPLRIALAQQECEARADVDEVARAIHQPMRVARAAGVAHQRGDARAPALHQVRAELLEQHAVRRLERRRRAMPVQRDELQQAAARQRAGDRHHVIEIVATGEGLDHGLGVGIADLAHHGVQTPHRFAGEAVGRADAVPFAREVGAEVDAAAEPVARARPSMPPELSPHHAASNGTRLRSPARPSLIRRDGETSAAKRSSASKRALKASSVWRPICIGGSVGGSTHGSGCSAPAKRRAVRWPRNGSFGAARASNRNVCAAAACCNDDIASASHPQRQTAAKHAPHEHRPHRAPCQRRPSGSHLHRR